MDRLTAEIVDELDASLVKVPVSLVFLQEVPVGLIKMFLHGIFLHISKYPLAGNPAVLPYPLLLFLSDAGELVRGADGNILIIAKTEGSTTDFPTNKI